MNDPPDWAAAFHKLRTTGPIDIRWNAIVFGAYVVLTSGRSPEAAAKLKPRDIPTESYWSDVLQDAVLAVLDPGMGATSAGTASKKAARASRALYAGVMPHQALLDFADLPLPLQIAQLVRKAKTRHDNKRLAMRRRRDNARDNHVAIHEHWSQVSAADLTEDMIEKERVRLFIAVSSERLQQSDFHLLLSLITEGKPNEARAAELGFPTATDLRNGFRRIINASKSIHRQFQEMDDDN